MALENLSFLQSHVQYICRLENNVSHHATCPVRWSGRMRRWSSLATFMEVDQHSNDDPWCPGSMEELGEPVLQVPSSPSVPGPIHNNVPHLQRLPLYPVMSWEEKEENRRVNIQRYNATTWRRTICTIAWKIQMHSASMRKGLAKAMAKPLTWVFCCLTDVHSVKCNEMAK